MTLFLLIAGLFVAAALALLLPSLLRPRPARAAASRPAANAPIYREQLEELAADLQRGAITQEEFERAGAEIRRRVVAENAESVASASPSVVPASSSVAPAKAGAQPLIAAIAVALLLPLAAAVGYWQLGNPGAMSAGTQSEGAHSVTREQMESLVERLRTRMEQTPDDPEGWMLLGRSYAVLGRYADAAGAYARAANLTPEDAALLADYADTLAMARGGKLAGEPFALAKRALEADPGNVKALALAGSAEFEQSRYEAAIGYWERIGRLLPPESEFARSVAESIAEARQRSGKTATAEAKAQPAASQAKPKRPAQAAGASLEGIVSLDPGMAGKVSPGDTVFVLARAQSGSRMPLAVARTTVAQLPYRFTLDDSMAMAPGATISSQARVVVAARVSKSGTAVPQKGDLEGASAPVAPGASGVKVVISRVVD